MTTTDEETQRRIDACNKAARIVRRRYFPTASLDDLANTAFLAIAETSVDLSDDKKLLRFAISAAWYRERKLKARLLPTPNGNVYTSKLIDPRTETDLNRSTGVSESDITDLHLALVKLDPSDIKLLHMYYVRQMPTKAIASELGYRFYGTAYDKVMTVVAKLRKLMGITKENQK
jgi:DNA-directed RNA polymerase specialized sigma24 family protein